MKTGDLVYDKRHGVSLIVDLVNDDRTLAIIAYVKDDRSRFTIANETDVIVLDIPPHLVELAATLSLGPNSLPSAGRPS